MTQVLADPLEETRRILAAAADAGVVIRAVGGVAVALRAPSVAALTPPRSYHDLDFVARPDGPAIGRLFTSLGYEPARQFNTLNGAERLLFHDPGGRRVDVFVDTLRMCHDLPLASRLEVDPMTLPLADLVLSKLQIVELTDRDAQDLAALLADHALTAGDDGVSLARIEQMCGNDWGWWRTTDGNLRTLATRWREAAWGPPSGAEPGAVAAAAARGGPEAGRESAAETAILGRAAERADELRAALEAAPKSIAWRVRAAVGPRLAWYSLPEEVR